MPTHSGSIPCLQWRCTHCPKHFSAVCVWVFSFDFITNIICYILYYCTILIINVHKYCSGWKSTHECILLQPSIWSSKLPRQIVPFPVWPIHTFYFLQQTTSTNVSISLCHIPNCTKYISPALTDLECLFSVIYLLDITNTPCYSYIATVYIGI